MDIQKFNQEIEKIIESLSNEELQSLHFAFLDKDCYGNVDHPKTGMSPEVLKAAIKQGLQRISIEELRAIAPVPIREAIDEFTEQERATPEEIHFPEPSDSQDPQGAQDHQESSYTPAHQTVSSSPLLLNQKKPVPVLDKGVNIKPMESIISDTARRALTSGVMIPECLHLIPKENRGAQVYAHMGIDSNGEAVSLLREDEKKDAPLSLIDLTAYFLGDVYIKFKATDSTLKSLQVERDMVVQSNAMLQQKARMYEKELIVKTLALSPQA